jgi:gliding motility-associated-like protein
MTKTFTILCLLSSFHSWAQCGYKATVHTNKDYCVGSSLIARSNHALQNIVWYRNGQPVSTAIGTQRLDTVPLIISLGKDSLFSGITRLCADGAGNIYAFSGAQVEIYRPGGTTTNVNIVARDSSGYFSDMFVDQPGNIYLIAGDTGLTKLDSTLVMKFAAATYDTTSLVSDATAGNATRYGLAASMFMDCQGNIYVYTTQQQVVKWTAGSKTGVLVASANNGNTNCSPPGGLGQVWVDNAGAIFFMVGTAIQKLAPGASQATTVISGGCINNLPPIWVSDFLLDGKDTLYQVGMDVGAKTVVIQKVAPGSTKPTDVATLPLDIFTGDFSTFTMDIKGNIFLADLVDNQLFELRRSSAIDSAYTPGDTGTYYAVVTDIQGYTTVTDTIVINSPTTTVPSISITATATSTPVCTPISFTANVSNAGLYPNLQWMVSGVKAGGDSNSYSYNLFANGDRVYCILSAQAGCNGPVTDTSNIITLSIDPHGAASVTISTPKDSICQGDTAVFIAMVINGSNQPVFQWLLNGDSTGDNSASFTRNNLSSGDVITCLITSDDVCGVAKSNSIPLTVSIPPTVESGQIFTILRGHSLQLDPVITGDISNYLWTPASGLSDPTIADPVANPDSNILYTLTLTAPGGCVASATILVNVYTPISIPGAFTPNGDGHNDLFYVLGGPVNSQVDEFAVFTRTGAEVFHVHHVAPGDPTFAWNGSFHGSPAPTGTYVYFVVMHFANGSSQVYKGTVLLVR